MYAGKIRIRACGLLKKDNELLLVKLTSPATNEDIWMPPGGGVEPGESLVSALKREFLEETGIQVLVTGFAHINEFIHGELHAIEFYFHVRRESGMLKLGRDPEFSNDEQLLKDLDYFSQRQIRDHLNVTPRYIMETYWTESQQGSIDINFFK